MQEIKKDETPVVEIPSPKAPKLTKVKNAAAVAGFYTAITAATAVPGYFGFRIAKMNYETARLNLEIAKRAAETVVKVKSA